VTNSEPSRSLPRKKRIEKKKPTAPHTVTVCQLTLPFLSPRHVTSDASSNGICSVPAEHVTTFYQCRYELRKAHFRPNTKSQQGLLLLLLLQLLSLFFIVIAHFLSLTPSLSHYLFLSQNFLLSPIPLIYSTSLLLFSSLKTLPLRIDVGMCCSLSIVCFCNDLCFLN